MSAGDRWEGRKPSSGPGHILRRQQVPKVFKPIQADSEHPGTQEHYPQVH